jgi:UDP-3-O-[3-hydroxymyristoyl] glucosamine N-acyltransferase
VKPFIHPSAIVETDSLGNGTRVWAFAHVLAGAVIGEDCNICDHTFIESDVILGDRVTVKCGIYLWNGTRVEDDAPARFGAWIDEEGQDLIPEGNGLWRSESGARYKETPAGLERCA